MSDLERGIHERSTKRQNEHEESIGGNYSSFDGSISIWKRIVYGWKK